MFSVKTKNNPTETTSTTTLPRRDCEPMQNLAFAKTHKTGGSTLQNIFLRYGYKNGLKFAIPLKNWIFSLDKIFDAETMVTKYDWNPTNTFNIMAWHGLWNGNCCNGFGEKKIGFGLGWGTKNIGFYMGVWKPEKITIGSFRQQRSV